MRHPVLTKLIPLVFCLAVAPLRGALAASPTVQDEPTAEDSAWLAATTAPKIIKNGTSLSGRNVRGGAAVVSIRLPGAEHHAK